MFFFTMKLFLTISLFHFVFLVIQLLYGLNKKEHYNKRNIQKLSLHSKDTVLILIPVCNENRHILKKTLLSVKRLKGNFKIFVIENSSLLEHKKSLIDTCKDLSIEYISIPRLGNKAKAINLCIKKYFINYKYLAIFDVDQQPDEFFLSKLLPILETDSKIALVQCPQAFRNRKSNLLSFFYSCMQKLYFEGISIYRDRLGFSTCFGTNFIVKISALKSVDYFDETIKNEDIATSFKLHTAGYKIKYHNTPLAYGLAPENFKSLIIQMKKYTISNNQLLFKILRNLPSLKYSHINFSFVIYYIHSLISLFIGGIFFYCSSICLYFYQLNFILFLSIYYC